MRLVKAAGAPAAMALASFLVACSSTDIPASAGSPKHAPRASPNRDQVGVASWYGRQFHGRRTANGERFDMNALTAAHPTLPLSTVVRVTNLDNGRSVAVRINDRGPFARGRIIDLSHAGARALGFEAQGTARVRVTVVDRSTLTAEREGDDRDGRGSAAATTSRPPGPRPRRRRDDPRSRGRGRPAARPSYLRVGPMRRRTEAAQAGRSG